MNGVMGKILLADLTAETFREENVPGAVYEQLIGGVGLGAWYLSRTIPPGADPLGPENVLGFVSGMLTGTGAVMTGRWMAVCKSPLTGGWGDANCGGTFSPAIKQCGYDAIFFRGQASRPVYLLVDHKGARLQDAADIWGMDTLAAEQTLIRRHEGRKKPAAAVIGPAGEKLSLISGISNDLGRFAARSGVGAVMGSKKLKAVVLAGIRRTTCADPEGVKELSREYGRKVRCQNLPPIVKGSFMTVLGKALGIPFGFPLDAMLTTGIFKKWGTIYNNTAGVVNGDSPLKNWGGSPADYPARSFRKINPDRIIARETQKYHCYSCVIGCGGICDISDLLPETQPAENRSPESRLPGERAECARLSASRLEWNGEKGEEALPQPGEARHSHKPEYETVCAFGGALLNDDLESIFIINDLCNRGGIDTISAGHAAAFAIECFENGVITADDTDGLELRWGDSRAVIELVRRIIAREGIGDILADGTKQAAARIGRGSEAFAVHAGGQEPGLHDSRCDPLLGVHFSADPTPGRHTIGAGLYYNTSHLWKSVSWAPKVRGIYPKRKEYRASRENALKTVANACYKAVVDAAGGCMFAMTTGIQHWKIFDFLNRASGRELTPDEYMRIGLRIHTLRQLFNIRQGIDPRTFIMHPRMQGSPPLRQGPNAGRTVPILDMVQAHWQQLGWSREDGKPLEQTIRELGIDHLLEGTAARLTGDSEGERSGGEGDPASRRAERDEAAARAAGEVER